MRKIFLTAAALPLATFLTGCTILSSPLVVRQEGDEAKPCKKLQSELKAIDADIHRKMPKPEKPDFFESLNAEQRLEIDALRQRYNHLVGIAAGKACAEDREPIPHFGDPQEYSLYLERMREKAYLAAEKAQEAKKQQEAKKADMTPFNLRQ